jgi:arylformamidase
MRAAREREAIAAMGRVLGPDILQRVYALYGPEEARRAAVQPATLMDAAYAEHARQRLDLYVPQDVRGAPVLLWVHGGGFLRGEKSSAEHPFNAHAGRWAARHGLIGAVMNYRLAPDHGWPAGGEDVGLAIDWLRSHVGEYGGDPDRIVAMGTSAGATHVATHLRLRAEMPAIRAAVLLSGLYGFTPLDERDTLYYGAADHYPERWPKEAMVATELPLFLACAEFDPLRFQQETIGLTHARLDARGELPRLFVAAGHNHFSLAYHIGSDDTRLTQAVLDFLGETL